MRKTAIIFLVIIAAFAIGFRIGTGKIRGNTNAVENDAGLVDTALVNAEKAYEDKFPTYTVQGGMMQPEDRYRYLVDRWYGFTFSVNGYSCIPANRADIDENQNNRTDSILQKRIGKDWRKKFESSVDSLYALDTLAVYITKNSIPVKRLISKKSKNKVHYTSYKCYSTNKGNLKIVNVAWKDRIYKDSVDVSFMRVIIDIREKKVKGIEESEMEWGPYWD